MARKDIAGMVSAAGLLTGIFTKLNDELEALGADPSDIHRLTTPDGDETIRQMARLIHEANRGILERPIEELGFNMMYVPDQRAYNCLKRVGIEIVLDLTAKTAAQLESIPNFGKKALEIVREKLAAHGLALKGEDPPVAPRPERPTMFPAQTISKLFELVRTVNNRVNLLELLTRDSQYTTHRTEQSDLRTLAASLIEQLDTVWGEPTPTDTSEVQYETALLELQQMTVLIASTNVRPAIHQLFHSLVAHLTADHDGLDPQKIRDDLLVLREMLGDEYDSLSAPDKLIRHCDAALAAIPGEGEPSQKPYE